jgi:hypothetical protein
MVTMRLALLCPGRYMVSKKYVAGNKNKNPRPSKARTGIGELRYRPLGTLYCSSQVT